MSMPTLERMVYCSRALVPTSSLLVIADILAVSHRNNARDGLTGALAISDGWFLQVLEGPPAALDSLLRRLERDPRHTDVVVLSRQPTTGRLFSDWSMASGRITPAIAADLVALIDECRVQPEVAVAALLRIIVEQSDSAITNGGTAKA